MQKISSSKRLFEDVQKVEIVLQERLWIGNIQPIHFDLVARLYAFAAAEQADQTRFFLDMLGFQRGQEDPRQFADPRCMAEIVLHEMFDRPAPAFVDIAQSLCHFDLHVEGQLIHRPVGDQMQMAAHSHQKVLGRIEGVVLVLGEDLQPDQF